MINVIIILSILVIAILIFIFFGGGGKPKKKKFPNATPPVKKNETVVKKIDSIINDALKVNKSIKDNFNYSTPPDLYGAWLLRKRNYSHKRTNK